MVNEKIRTCSYGIKIILGVWLLLLSLPAIAEGNWLTGTVTDQQGHPLVGVDIRQQFTLSSVLSDSQGHFRLKYTPQNPMILLLHKEGYQRLEYPFSLSQESPTIILETSTLEPEKGITKPALPVPSSVFYNYLGAFYQIHNQNLSQNGRLITGFGLNDLALEGLYRREPWVLAFRLFRNRSPIDIQGLNFEPAFNVDTIHTSFLAGRHERLSQNVEALYGLRFIYQNNSPDNRDQNRQPILYSGTLLDFRQDRFVAGLGAVIGWQLTPELAFMLEGDVAGGGLLLERIDRTLSPFIFFADAGLILKYKLAAGIMVQLGYTKQFWLHQELAEHSDFLRVGISVEPWQLNL